MAPLRDTAYGFQPDSVLITAFTNSGSNWCRCAASLTIRSRCTSPRPTDDPALSGLTEPLKGGDVDPTEAPAMVP
jgi:hypothetical protein